MIKQIRRFSIVLLFVSLLTNCGYNKIQELDEEVTAAWAEVLNQYKRRSDLIPNLEAAVKGFAKQEKEIIQGIADARSKLGSIQATPELINDPEAFAKFNQAQGQLGSAISRLLVVQENYPELKSNERFGDLMAQLEGTENRVTVARNRFIKATKEYNIYIRQFPAVLTAKAFGYEGKPTFTVEDVKAVENAPKVQF
ncbi:LemA family protein [Leptospira ilyithenensis]|uniref:LemA family protein n=1 Tax=Leptospira ilyithenensis TaxID=2484901 RepID=A0A4R9LQD8_9LEPT|nr:LemA family protein [Leptospira ilyithenensis]TGN10255.1 LemA family protein [Leptospira ilyithenensis]